jgi:hypothetical protein
MGKGNSIPHSVPTRFLVLMAASKIGPQSWFQSIFPIQIRKFQCCDQLPIQEGEMALQQRKRDIKIKKFMLCRSGFSLFSLF